MGGEDWNTTRAWVYRSLLAVLVLGSLTVLARTIVGGGDDGDQPPREKVERVRGGDAVKLKSGEKLVYAGIRSPRGEEPLSVEAEQRNAELVEGRRVRLRFDEQRRNHAPEHAAVPPNRDIRMTHLDSPPRRRRK